MTPIHFETCWLKRLQWQCRAPTSTRTRSRSSRPAHAAAGATAVAVAMRRAIGQMGVRRTASTLTRLNQVDGFDCQGCAWPDPAPGHRHVAEFCENGAKAVAEEATRQLLDREFFATHSVEDLAGRTEFWLGKQGRITEPMVLRPGATHYTPISWDDAFATMAEHLHRLDSPDQATFYTSGKTSNEAAFVYQLFARAFGTNNLPDCSNMCHESSGSALVGHHRHRQGLGQPRGHPPGQAAPDRRPEPGHQPPADALGAGGGEVPRRPHHLDQPAPGGGPGPLQEPAEAPRGSRSGPRWPTCTCRSGSTATWRSSRRWARCWSSGTRSTTTSSTSTPPASTTTSPTSPTSTGPRSRPRPA